MLTKVYLDGSMGANFGTEWEFEINSPREALLMVDANKPGFINWLRRHASKYTHYQVVAEYEDGRSEQVSEDTFLLQRKMVSIRFVPVLQGAGKWGGVIVGVIVIIVGVIYGVFTEDWVTAAKIIQAGGEMVILGAIQALTTKTPNSRLNSAGPGSKDPNLSRSTSFDGIANTTQQGVPVPIIYGRHLVGAHTISAGMVVEQTI